MADPVAIITAIVALLQILEETGILTEIINLIKQLIASLTPAQQAQLKLAVAKLGYETILKAAGITL